MSEISPAHDITRGRPPTLRLLGRVDYAATLDEMRAFTETRDANTPDEI